MSSVSTHHHPALSPIPALTAAPFLAVTRESNIKTCSVTTTQKPSKPHQTQETLQLQPIKGLHFEPKTHKYTYRGKTIQASVTTILSFNLDDFARQRIEATRHEWEPRGNFLHQMCEHWWLGAAQLDPGPYKDWADNLFSHPLFTRYKAIGVETRLVDKRSRYAGSCDFVLQGPGTDGRTRTLVCDLKTKSRPDSAIGDHRGQLGAYCSMLIQHWPTLWIDNCLIVNSFPNKVEVSTYSVQECLAAWDDRYQAFADWKPSF